MSRLDPFAARVFCANRVAPAGGATREIVNPSTLKTEGRTLLCDATTVATTAAEARAVQVGCARSDLKTRAALLHRLASSIEEPPLCGQTELLVRDRHQASPIFEAPGNMRYGEEWTWRRKKCKEVARKN
jgi:acyl-CoA reductase-like NAD-dependent aldehyde dehydrogenase